MCYNAPFPLSEFRGLHSVRLNRFNQPQTRVYPVNNIKSITLLPTNEPPRDKTNKMTLRPAKTQISLGIRPVWSESSLSAWRKLGSLATHWAHSEDSDQTGRCPGWSESSLGAQSLCWFCHEAVQLIILIGSGNYQDETSVLVSLVQPMVVILPLVYSEL